MSEGLTKEQFDEQTGLIKELRATVEKKEKEGKDKDAIVLAKEEKLNARLDQLDSKNQELTKISA